MALVTTHPVSNFRASLLADAGRRAADRLWAHCNHTPEQRAELYVSRMPIAVLAG